MWSKLHKAVKYNKESYIFRENIITLYFLKPPKYH